jgi:cytochrome c553
MSHTNNKLVACLTLIALITSIGALAQNDVNHPLKGSAETSAGDDSAESIRLRKGPGDPVAGKDKSLLCQGCHGEFGDSTDPFIPKLAGQYGKYISKQVRNYQAGIRSHQIMNAMAATLNDDDLADVSAYFASQPKMKGDHSTENPIGKNLFLYGDLPKMRLACVNCHGVRGKGLDPNTSMFPVIGGQQKEYIRIQLVNFRDGYRTNSPNGIMTRIADSLTDTEIESLAEYVSEQ